MTIARNEKGDRVNASTSYEYGADRESLRDAQIEIKSITGAIEALIKRIRAAADDHGYVYEQCTNAADALICLAHDEIKPALRILECAIHDQGGIP